MFQVTSSSVCYMMNNFGVGQHHYIAEQSQMYSLHIDCHGTYQCTMQCNVLTPPTSHFYCQYDSGYNIDNMVSLSP